MGHPIPEIQYCARGNANLDAGRANKDKQMNMGESVPTSVIHALSYSLPQLTILHLTDSNLLNKIILSYAVVWFYNPSIPFKIQSNLISKLRRLN